MISIEQINAQHRRQERAHLLATTVDQMNPMRWAEMSEEKKTAWIQYRQALLDISKQEGWPFNVQWPTKPE